MSIWYDVEYARPPVGMVVAAKRLRDLVPAVSVAAAIACIADGMAVWEFHRCRRRRGSTRRDTRWALNRPAEQMPPNPTGQAPCGAGDAAGQPVGLLYSEPGNAPTALRWRVPWLSRSPASAQLVTKKHEHESSHASMCYDSHGIAVFE